MTKGAQEVKPAGRGEWTAHCPAHDDAYSSLSIAVGGDGRVLLKCFVGCSYEAIRDVLGLTDRDMGPQESRA
jgi:hypothetical protein